MPLLPSKSCGTALWEVHIISRLDHKSPHKSALEACYTLWLEPPHSCSAYLHNRKVLITPKYPMRERRREVTDQWISF